MMWPVCWVQESNSTQAEINKYINNWLNFTNNLIFLRQCSLARPIRRYEQNNSVFKIPDKNAADWPVRFLLCSLHSHTPAHLAMPRKTGVGCIAVAMYNNVKRNGYM